MLFNFGRTKRTFSRGVSTPELKDATKDKAIRRLPFPPALTIPLAQHLGAPARPIVRVGQEVVRGEPIAEPDGFLSVAVHAPATGVIQEIGEARDASGTVVPVIVLKVFKAASQEILYGAPVDVDALSPEEIIRAVQEAGIVGLGGQAFPTHAKLALPDRRKVDTVIANACESEPYLTTDYRILLERTAEVLRGLQIVLKTTGAARGIVAVERTKTELIEALEKNMPAGLPVRIEQVDPRYPLGFDRVLIRALLGREVPHDGLPIDVGAAVFNIATLAEMGDLLPRHGGLIERVVTVSGPGVDKPGNYQLAIGTPLRFVLAQAGVKADAAQTILGGPLSGHAVANLDAPVTKGMSGIVVLTAHEPYRANGKSFPCIRCGACIEACPVGLNPSQLHADVCGGAAEAAVERHHLLDCVECGCCAYVCPSNLPLVQEFRVAKAATREAKAAS